MNLNSSGYIPAFRLYNYKSKQIFEYNEETQKYIKIQAKVIQKNWDKQKFKKMQQTFGIAKCTEFENDNPDLDRYS